MCEKFLNVYVVIFQYTFLYHLLLKFILARNISINRWYLNHISMRNGTENTNFFVLICFLKYKFQVMFTTDTNFENPFFLYNV